MMRGGGAESRDSQNTTQGELELPCESETSAKTLPASRRQIPALLSSAELWLLWCPRWLMKQKSSWGLSDTDNQTVLCGPHSSSPRKKALLISP